MQINTEIYGSPESWNTYFNISSSFTGDLPKNVNFSNDVNNNQPTLGNGSEIGKIQINEPIDTSVCPIGVDENCSLVHQYWVQNNLESYNDLDQNQKVGMTINASNPLLFFSGYNAIYGYRNGNQQMLFDSLNSAAQNAWSYNQISPNADENLKPIAYFPTSIIYVIFVKCFVEWDGSSYLSLSNVASFDLYTYLNGKDSNNVPYYEKYPNIINISLLPFYKRTKTSDSTVYYEPLGSTSSPYSGTAVAVCNPLNTFKDPKYSIERQIFRYAQPTIRSQAQYTYIKSDNTQATFGAGYVGFVIHGSPEFKIDFVSGYKNNQYIGYIGENIRLDTMNNSSNTSKNSLIIYNNINDFGSIDQFKEYCLTQAAYLGGFFTIETRTIYKNVTDDPYIYDTTYCGIIDEDGVTHGQYTHGEENKDQPQYTWDSLQENPYDPTKKPEVPDTERPSDPYKYAIWTNLAVSAGKYYFLTSALIENLQVWMQKVSNPEGPFAPAGEKPNQGEYSYEDLGYQLQSLFNGGYPDDNILFLMYYPFDLSSPSYITYTDETIKLGNTETKSMSWFGSALLNNSARRFTGISNYYVFNSGNYLVQETFGDFRDYAPYTNLSLQVAYHGSIDLNPGDWYGHNINVRMIIDILTGTSVAVIERDGIAFQTIDGQVGVQVPLLARNIGDYTSTLINTSQQANSQRLGIKKGILSMINGFTSSVSSGVNGVVNSAVGAFTGNISSLSGVNSSINAMSSGLGNVGQTYLDTKQLGHDYKNTKYQVAHASAGTSVVSVASPNVSVYMEPSARLLFTYPKFLPNYNKNIYANTVGFACCITGKIGSFSGYSEFSNAKIDGINCTDTEKEMILNTLKNGVYI